jgi:hypothetical protein
MLLRQLLAAIARSAGVRVTWTSFSAAAKVAGSTSGPTGGAVANAGGVPAAGSVPAAGFGTGGGEAGEVGCWAPAVVVVAVAAVVAAAAVAAAVAVPAMAAEVRRKSRREVDMLLLPLWQLGDRDNGQAAMAQSIYGSYAEDDIVF